MIISKTWIDLEINWESGGKNERMSDVVNGEKLLFSSITENINLQMMDQKSVITLPTSKLDWKFV